MEFFHVLPESLLALELFATIVGRAGQADLCRSCLFLRLVRAGQTGRCHCCLNLGLVTGHFDESDSELVDTNNL